MLPQTKGIGGFVTERKSKAADSEDRKQGAGYKRQGQERAKHAVVDSESVGREVTVVMDVMQTSIARRGRLTLLIFVRMERS